MHLKGTFLGPEGTPYDGGVFEVDIVVPQGYPFTALKMKVSELLCLHWSVKSVLSLFYAQSVYAFSDVFHVDQFITKVRWRFIGRIAVPFRVFTFLNWFYSISDLPSEYILTERGDLSRYSERSGHIHHLICPLYWKETSASYSIKDAWTPVLTLRSTLVSLQSLLCSPEPKDPQDAEVAKHYLSDRPGFDSTAHYWTG